MAATNISQGSSPAVVDTDRPDPWHRIARLVVRLIREFPIDRVPRFLWLASGMFSASALFLAFIGYFALSGADDAGRNFTAAVVSGALFATATILRFGPDSA
jgi:hypothetical protein